jgi:hypothetical protein
MKRLVLACACLLLLVAPAAAAAKGQDRVVVVGPVNIAPGQQANDVVVAHGDVNVAGRVNGDLVVADGKVRINGLVKGDVVTFASRAVLGPRARVNGDLRYGDKKPTIAPGAQVGGDTKHLNVGKAGGLGGLVAGVVLWLAISVSALLLGLLLLWLVPRAAYAVWETAETRRAASIWWGLGLFFGIPIVAGILLVTILGIPLGLLLLLALVPIYALAYTTSAWVLGRRVLGPERGRFLSFLAGWAILRVLALIPILGGLAWFAATVFGLGLLFVTAGRGRAVRTEAPPAPAPA